jgi:flagellar biogenesis protein FliO
MNNILMHLAFGACLGLVLVALYGLTRLARRIAWRLVERAQR